MIALVFIFAVFNYILVILLSLLVLLDPFIGSAASLILELVIIVIKEAIGGAVLLPFNYIFWKKLQETVQ